ncbi:hypothetical protein EDD18DRAFT_1462310 [Armillaria luteobubalina]|uniref:Uncharacterized protein n=1 Tax=Armillaria luteobubalina TaxID=153913 RepID=A0AA39Q771_9AGAR|nr:hypothetical protein EDD18DRAFT_1462310 [Armillaria luteobubalina]
MSTPTPWSSLPSDRIKPQSQSQKTPKQKQKQKQKQQGGAQPNPKSRQLLALENLLHAVQSTGANANAVPDPKGGSRTPPFPLHPRLPHLRAPPLHAQPPAPRLPALPPPPAPRLTESAIVKLQGEIGELERREEEARERERREVGAFPALGGGGGSGRATPTMVMPPAPSQHKVLSVNSKTKKVTVSSYSNTPVPSRPQTPQTPEPLRVPPPPAEVVYAKRKVDPGRPYANFGGGAARYVLPDKGKGKGRERGGEVGAS